MEMQTVLVVTLMSALVSHLKFYDKVFYVLGKALSGEQIHMGINCITKGNNFCDFQNRFPLYVKIMLLVEQIQPF